jgi:hypothetical protein
MWALWGKMGIDITGQHGIFALLANNDLELWQMDELVHFERFLTLPTS